MTCGDFGGLTAKNEPCKRAAGWGIAGTDTGRCKTHLEQVPEPTQHDAPIGYVYRVDVIGTVDAAESVLLTPYKAPVKPPVDDPVDPVEPSDPVEPEEPEPTLEEFGVVRSFKSTFLAAEAQVASFNPHSPPGAGKLMLTGHRITADKVEAEGWKVERMAVVPDQATRRALALLSREAAGVDQPIRIKWNNTEGRRGAWMAVLEFNDRVAVKDPKVEHLTTNKIQQSLGEGVWLVGVVFRRKPESLVMPGMTVLEVIDAVDADGHTMNGLVVLVENGALNVSWSNSTEVTLIRALVEPDRVPDGLLFVWARGTEFDEAGALKLEHDLDTNEPGTASFSIVRWHDGVPYAPHGGDWREVRRPFVHTEDLCVLKDGRNLGPHDAITVTTADESIATVEYTPGNTPMCEE
jgi:hypothetical protein